MVVSAPAPDEGRKKAHLSKQGLTACRVDLLELMQLINFGRIENLPVLDGDPVLEPMPRIIREIKFGGDNGARPELDASNFVLKTQVVELFQQFDRMRNGTIEVLEIKHGLPFRMFVAEDAA